MIMLNVTQNIHCRSLILPFGFFLHHTLGSLLYRQLLIKHYSAVKGDEDSLSNTAGT